MDKISDHPGFKAQPRLTACSAPDAATTPADFAGSAMVAMITGCILNHAMQHGTKEALDVAMSVMLSATIALEISEGDLIDILSFMPEARQKILDQRAGSPGESTPDPAS